MQQEKPSDKAASRTLLAPTHEQTREERTAHVKSQLYMLPQYEVIRDPSDQRLYAPNAYVNNPQTWIKEAQTLVGHLFIEQGVGLAAPQIGLNIRMVAVKIPDHKVLVLFNPVIEAEASELLNNQEDLEWATEGCVSHPGIWLDVARLKKVAVRASTLSNPREQLHHFEGYVARVVQHEIDHVNGRLITDLGMFKKNLIVDPVGQAILFGENRKAAEQE